MHKTVFPIVSLIPWSANQILFLQNMRYVQIYAVYYQTNQNMSNCTFVVVLSELAMQHHPHCVQSPLITGQDLVSSAPIKTVTRPQALQLDV